MKEALTAVPNSRIGEDDAQYRVPVVFFHGLGFGLVMYLHLLSKVNEKDVFLVELPHISTRMWEQQPSPRRMAAALETILSEFNFTQASFVAHSFGTFAVTWIVKHKPAIVHSMLLLDPVCLMLYLPKVCFTFCYKLPHDLNTLFRSLLVIILLSLRYKTFFLRFLWFSRELNISHTMFRHFWWQVSHFLPLSPLPFLHPPCRNAF